MDIGGDKYEIRDYHFIVEDSDYENTLTLTGFHGREAKVVTKEVAYSKLVGSLFKVKYGREEALRRGKQPY